MVIGTVLNFNMRYEDDLRAKVAPRFGCAKQSKNLKSCLSLMHLHLSYERHFWLTKLPCRELKSKARIQYYFS